MTDPLDPLARAEDLARGAAHYIGESETDGAFQAACGTVAQALALTDIARSLRALPGEVAALRREVTGLRTALTDVLAPEIIEVGPPPETEPCRVIDLDAPARRWAQRGMRVHLLSEPGRALCGAGLSPDPMTYDDTEPLGDEVTRCSDCLVVAERGDFG